MTKITVRNFGPIKEATFTTRKLTLFIGNQSSGKSTLSKIISFCFWLEKEALIRQELSFVDNDYIEENLLKFHHIRSYRNDGYYIEYCSDTLIFKYGHNLSSVKWNTQSRGKRSPIAKISYISSARNLFATPNIESLPVSNDNIRDTIFSWLNIRKKYNANNKIEILDLGLTYYYNEKSNADTLILEDGEREITIDEASSGIQSLVPLYIWIDYLTRWIYKNKPDTTFEKERLKMATIEAVLRKSVDNYDETLSSNDLLELLNKPLSDKIRDLQADNKLDDEHALELRESIAMTTSIIDNILNIKYSNIIVEEPEQNLFPKTQRNFVYHLLESIKDHKHNHQLVITTHSPYMLYAVNNCIMGGLLESSCQSAELDGISFKGSFIDPSLTAIYKIEDGQVHSIQSEDGTIGENYFDDIMKSVMDDYYQLLEHYEENEEIL